MNKITDDDLTLLYYGEHEDAGLATTVAGSEQLSERFEALSAELKMAENFAPPERGDDYGAEVWQKISPRLEDKQHNTAGPLQNWFSSLAKPKFSFAGLTAIAMLTVVAFLLGRQDGPGQDLSPSNPPQAQLAATSSIDPGRLLTSSVSGHLEQINVVFTEFANLPETSSREAGNAMDMLLANRLYRQAAVAQGDPKLAAFLSKLEPILLELAYEAQTASPATRERMQREVNDDLLFKVRVMNKQLNKSEISL
jgi:hypothetical protein